MSVARPAAGRLLSRCAKRAAAPVRSPVVFRPCTASCRAFHSSRSLAVRQRPRFNTTRLSERDGMRTADDFESFAKEKFPEYTAADKEELRKHFSPEQIAALEAAEAAVDPMDLTIQGRLRDDPYRLHYIDDMRDVQPVIDRRPRTKPAPDPNSRFMTEEEFSEDFIKWAENFFPSKAAKMTIRDFVSDDLKNIPEKDWSPRAREAAERKLVQHLMSSEGQQKLNEDYEGPNDIDILEYWLERSALIPPRPSNSALAPALPRKVPGVEGLYKRAIDSEDDSLDETGEYQDVKKKTGLSVKQLKSLTVKSIVTRFVSQQTRLGKIRRASVLAVAGNRDGWLGLGTATSIEPAMAMTKAKLDAIKNMKPIRRYENRTIYGTVEAKVGGSVVRIDARPPGFGLRVPSTIFEMCRAAGIHDMASKMLRSRNALNVVKATYEALLKQPDPEEIAIGRGKKLVDVRKVYYGKSLC
ncbi:hypothetical protein VTK73DRAFT_7828 [Phialemonium thermophilum]|uniref:S5 DRBM domain-containing protein n=1 Tax=Phialemonium thermophilum TaxID=223376 RepID=A0ABR3XSI8_9PEZI